MQSQSKAAKTCINQKWNRDYPIPLNAKFCSIWDFRLAVISSIVFNLMSPPSPPPPPTPRFDSTLFGGQSWPTVSKWYQLIDTNSYTTGTKTCASLNKCVKHDMYLGGLSQTQPPVKLITLPVPTNPAINLHIVSLSIYSIGQYDATIIELVSCHKPKTGHSLIFCSNKCNATNISGRCCVFLFMCLINSSWERTSSTARWLRVRLQKEIDDSTIINYTKAVLTMQGVLQSAELVASSVKWNGNHCFRKPKPTDTDTIIEII